MDHLSRLSHERFFLYTTPYSYRWIYVLKSRLYMVAVQYYSMPITRYRTWRGKENRTHEDESYGPARFEVRNKRMKQIGPDKKLVSWCERVHPWKLMFPQYLVLYDSLPHYLATVRLLLIITAAREVSADHFDRAVLLVVIGNNTNPKIQ